jgi:hypothetical protein
MAAPTPPRISTSLTDTTDERDIQETRVHSVIHDLALSAKDGLERAIMFAGLWTGKDYSNVGVNLNADFTNTADKMKQVALLLQAYDKRGISRETFLAEARNLDFLSDDFDPVAELARMAAVDAVELGAAPEGKPSPQSSALEKPTAPADFPNGQTRPTRQI